MKLFSVSETAKACCLLVRLCLKITKDQRVTGQHARVHDERREPFQHSVSLSSGSKSQQRFGSQPPTSAARHPLQPFPNNNRHSVLTPNRPTPQNVSLWGLCVSSVIHPLCVRAHNLSCSSSSSPHPPPPPHALLLQQLVEWGSKQSPVRTWVQWGGGNFEAPFEGAAQRAF